MLIVPLLLKDLPIEVFSFRKKNENSRWKYYNDMVCSAKREC